MYRKREQISTSSISKADTAQISKKAKLDDESYQQIANAMEDFGKNKTGQGNPDPLEECVSRGKGKGRSKGKGGKGNGGEPKPVDPTDEAMDKARKMQTLLAKCIITCMQTLSCIKAKKLAKDIHAELKKAVTHMESIQKALRSAVTVKKVVVKDLKDYCVQGAKAMQKANDIDKLAKPHK